MTMGRITNTFLKGLATALPISLSIYAVYWLLTTSERILGKAMQALLTDAGYVPGMGVAAGFALMLLLGMLMNLWLFRRLVAWGESILERIPLVKTIYGGVRDMMGFFAKNPEAAEGHQVVAVSFGEDRRLLGFITSVA